MKIVLALPALLLACGLAAQAQDEGTWYNDSYHTSYIYSGLNDATQAYPAADNRGMAGGHVSHSSVGLFGGLGFYNSGLGYGYHGGHDCGCGHGGGSWGACPEPRRNLHLWDGYCSGHAVCHCCQGALDGLYHHTFCEHGKLNRWGRGLKARWGSFCHGSDCGCGHDGCDHDLLDGEVVEPTMLDEQLTDETIHDNPPPTPPLDMGETSDVYLEGAGLDGTGQEAAEENADAWDAGNLYDALLGDPSSD